MGRNDDVSIPTAELLGNEKPDRVHRPSEAIGDDRIDLGRCAIAQLAEQSGVSAIMAVLEHDSCALAMARNAAVASATVRFDQKPLTGLQVLGLVQAVVRRMTGRELVVQDGYHDGKCVTITTLGQGIQLRLLSLHGSTFFDLDSIYSGVVVIHETEGGQPKPEVTRRGSERIIELVVDFAERLRSTYTYALTERDWYDSLINDRRP